MMVITIKVFNNRYWNQTTTTEHFCAEHSAIISLNINDIPSGWT